MDEKSAMEEVARLAEANAVRMEKTARSPRIQVMEFRFPTPEDWVKGMRYFKAYGANMKWLFAQASMCLNLAGIPGFTPKKNLNATVDMALADAFMKLLGGEVVNGDGNGDGKKRGAALYALRKAWMDRQDELEKAENVGFRFPSCIWDEARIFVWGHLKRKDPRMKRRHCDLSAAGERKDVNYNTELSRIVLQAYECQTTKRVKFAEETDPVSGEKMLVAYLGIVKGVSTRVILDGWFERLVRKEVIENGKRVMKVVRERDRFEMEPRAKGVVENILSGEYTLRRGEFYFRKRRSKGGPRKLRPFLDLCYDPHAKRTARQLKKEEEKGETTKRGMRYAALFFHKTDGVGKDEGLVYFPHLSTDITTSKEKLDKYRFYSPPVNNMMGVLHDIRARRNAVVHRKRSALGVREFRTAIKKKEKLYTLRREKFITKNMNIMANDFVRCLRSWNVGNVIMPCVPKNIEVMGESFPWAAFVDIMHTKCDDADIIFLTGDAHLEALQAAANEETAAIRARDDLEDEEKERAIKVIKERTKAHKEMLSGNISERADTLIETIEKKLEERGMRKEEDEESLLEEESKSKKKRKPRKRVKPVRKVMVKTKDDDGRTVKKDASKLRTKTRKRADPKAKHEKCWARHRGGQQGEVEMKVFEQEEAKRKDRKSGG